MFSVFNNTQTFIQAGAIMLLPGQLVYLPAVPPELTPAIINGQIIVSNSTANDLVADSAGLVFSPASSAHTYSYDGSGNLLTDTAVLSGITRIKTYTWTNSQLTGESQWVKQ